MTSDELKKRTKKFALDVIDISALLPKDRVGDILARQLVRAATSVGANYRAACRARSKADFISKIKIVEEESDESMYWLELILEKKLLPERECKLLLSEADELTAIFSATAIQAKRNQ